MPLDTNTKPSKKASEASRPYVYILKNLAQRERRRTLGTEVEALKQLKNFVLTTAPPVVPGELTTRSNNDSCPHAHHTTIREWKASERCIQMNRFVGVASFCGMTGGLALHAHKYTLAPRSGAVFPNATGPTAQSQRTKGQSTRKR